MWNDTRPLRKLRSYRSVRTGVEYDEDVYKEVDDDERTEMPLLFDDG